MRQEGITHIPPLQTCTSLEQSRSCLCVQPGLGMAPSCSGNAVDHFPTVSTCLEVSSYDLQGNAVSRFYCPEKEMGMINQGEAEEPRPSPRSLQAQQPRPLRARPARAESPEGGLCALSPTKLQTRQE